MMVLLLRLVLAALLLGAFDLYVFQSIRTLSARWQPRPRRLLRWGYWLLSLGFLAILFWASIRLALAKEHLEKDFFAMHVLMGAAVLIFLPKLCIALFLLAEDALRGLRWSLRRGRRLVPRQIKLIGPGGGVVAVEQPPSPALEAGAAISRSEFLSKSALAVAAVPALAVTNGILRGRYNFQVHRHVLHFPNLPPAFEGFRLAQLSDLHMGSFDSPRDAMAGFRLLQEEAPDAIVLTGDAVNDAASELEPYLGAVKDLHAPMGKFSVLGNHDYGDYLFGHGSSPEKRRNFARLLDHQAHCGFDLLRNEHRILTRGRASIALAGVENWGLPPFPQYGDLDAATAGLAPEAFTILLSHDPTHWDAKARAHPKQPELTLSGHTHGLQFGIELGDWRWSPAELKYPRWAGLYWEGSQALYVNRGYGYLAFPGRVGILPEITILELRRAQA